MPTLLARNATVLVTMDDGRRELANAGLFARDGILEQVGPTKELPTSADLVLDLAGQIVLPGFVNTHHHLDQTLTRNLPAAQNNNLFPWLKVHYRVWASRTPEASRCSMVIEDMPTAIGPQAVVQRQPIAGILRIVRPVPGPPASGCAPSYTARRQRGPGPALPPVVARSTCGTGEPDPAAPCY